MTMFKPSLLAVVSTLALSGCGTLAPTYERPAAPVSATWTTDTATASTTELGWRDFFTDAQLQQLIEQALANNRDLRVAALNVEKAQAQYRVQRADLFPSVNAGVGQTAQRLPADVAGAAQPVISHQYTATLGVSSYELDLFGRIRSLKDAALSTYLGTEEARRSTQISLIAQVAEAYATLAADRERLALAQETMHSQLETLRLTERRHALGVSSALDLHQVQSTVESARADVATYTSQVAQDVNSLTLLVGAPLKAEQMAAKDTQLALTLTSDLPVGLPSEVLLKRPDVMEAERSLQSANANIGAARAAFFPSITLTASAGGSSTQLSNLFQGGQGYWSFVPQITLPIFDAGRNSANLKVAEVNRDIALAQYEKAIQSAFKDVADALAQRATIADQVEAKEALARANEASFRLSQARYQKGVDDYLSALDSQRSLYSAQQGLITARLSQQVNRITLYKVLGGGVAERSDPKAATTQPD